MKKKFFRTSVLLMSGVILSGFVAPTVSASADAKEANGEQQVIKTNNESNTNSDNVQNRIDEQSLNNAVNISNMLNSLSSSDKQDFNDQSYLQDLTNKMNLMTGKIDKVDSIYIQEHQFDNFGKVGLTAKAAAKILKAGLHKLGRKGYEKIAKASGLDLVKLNFKTMTKIVDYLDNFNGQAGDVLKQFLMNHLGFNDFMAGLTAGTIVNIFL
ncbi:hypothetical protein [Apilactobacillus micheneri]|uniref:hypothetical protein n=1 Tax=Apilactobacillus micheneri TaxID=1899430 RepID=UPI00112827DF|nr:hypothetical protein [Apilactobacillus micheneri]TPR50763.1 hypothetical protein DY126_06860 [Apilactobacillus micheneri]